LLKNSLKATRKIVSKVVPVYPELANKMQMRGTVKVEVVVAPNGKVKFTQVLGGSPLLAKAAVDAIEKWKWGPAPQETKTHRTQFSSLASYCSYFRGVLNSGRLTEVKKLFMRPYTLATLIALSFGVIVFSAPFSRAKKKQPEGKRAIVNRVVPSIQI